MNISSLIKVFGIAAAGFVPRAQANPFGISFVKVDPPKDKKEEAICFRLKLSQTDVFSEKKFTDITFRSDTTVFLQKQMLIDDEEEILKKTFKNFNAEKDPFEIPDKYLPLEDKDRAEWVDKDGKPLKFLVVVYGSKNFQHKKCNLIIPGDPKQPVFRFMGEIGVFGTVDWVRTEYCQYLDLKEIENRGISPERSIDCLLAENALVGFNMDLWSFKGIRVLFHTDGNCFQACHVPSESYFEGKIGSTKIKTPFCVFTPRSLCACCGCGRITSERHAGCYDYAVVVMVWNSSQKNAEYVEVKVALDRKDGFDEGHDASIASKGEWVVSVNVFRNVTRGLAAMCSVKGGGGIEKWGELEKDGKVTGGKPNLDADCFVFFFPKEQAQPQK